MRQILRQAGNLSCSSGSAGRTASPSGPVTHILVNGTTVRTVACPVPQAARPGCAAPPPQPPRLPDQLTVKRRVSVRGAIMIGGQRIQVGLPHAGKTADVTIETDTCQIAVGEGITITAPRKTSNDIKRHKASGYGPKPT